MSFLLFSSYIFLTFAGLAQCLNAAGWRSQSIYQVLTDRFARTDGSTTAACDLSEYCGGTWQGIISQLDYIQDMGFTAIWISPVVQNIQVPGTNSDGQAYHGYWAQDIYQVNTNFGSASDLVALSNALHARGMYLMVDVVTNHMGYRGCGECVDYSTFNPFNEESYFHPFCLIDYDNATSVEVCWEGDNKVSLPDLRTENSTVLSMWETWIEQLVANYTIDGLRIDSAMEVDEAFFPPFLEAAGVYAVAEVYNGNEYELCPMQESIPGMLNYPAYYWITQAFESTSGSISNLVKGLSLMSALCEDTSILGSFLENHDIARFPSFTSDMSLAKNAIGFTMLADGIPIVYQGQEQYLSGSTVPENREAIWLSSYSTTSTLYTFITTMNKIRRQAIEQDSNYLTASATTAYSDSSTIVMRKGSTGSQVIGVFSNSGVSGSHSFTLTSSNSGFTAGQSVTELINCTTYKTDSSGNLAVTITGGLPQVFYPTSELSGNSVCNSTTSATTSSAASSTNQTSTALSKATSTSSFKSSTSTKATTSSCVKPTAVPVTFEQNNVTTKSGQTIKLVGSISQLGKWNTSRGVVLTYEDYDECDTYWTVDIDLPAGQVIEYKYIRVSTSGSVTWEADPNHTMTVSSGCQATAGTVVSDDWQNW
ncbi:alpha-amylase [Delphinella strobiligena]|nr:alpha-amylase [Delphinella strobiligena]